MASAMLKAIGFGWGRCLEEVVFRPASRSLLARFGPLPIPVLFAEASRTPASDQTAERNCANEKHERVREAPTDKGVVECRHRLFSFEDEYLSKMNRRCISINRDFRARLEGCADGLQLITRQLTACRRPVSPRVSSACLRASLGNDLARFSNRKRGRGTDREGAACAGRHAAQGCMLCSSLTTRCVSVALFVGLLGQPLLDHLAREADVPADAYAWHPARANCLVDPARLDREEMGYLIGSQQRAFGESRSRISCRSDAHDYC